jgi:hypothetical protein
MVCLRLHGGERIGMGVLVRPRAPREWPTADMRRGEHGNAARKLAVVEVCTSEGAR